MAISGSEYCARSLSSEAVDPESSTSASVPLGNTILDAV